MVALIEPQALASCKFSTKVEIVDRGVDDTSGTVGVRPELPNPKISHPRRVEMYGDNLASGLLQSFTIHN